MHPGFRAIGERLGPFDVTMFEVGAYDTLWTDVHLGAGRTAAALGVVRVGWDVFADVGVGVGYAWAHRSKSFGDVSGGDVGGALGVRAGARITDALAIIARASVIDRYRAPIFVGVGIEWQL